MYQTINDIQMIGKEDKNAYIASSFEKKEHTNNYHMIKLLKKSVLALLFFIPLLFAQQEAKASHMMGADITYQCIDTLKFKVTIKYFRDCRGIPFSISNFTVRCTNGSSRTVSLTLDNIKEITPVCSTQPGGCIPTNTSASEGIEQHTYTAILDFNTLPLSALANCTGKIRIETGQCCRNGAINTGPLGNFFTYAEIDIAKAPCNSSPALTSEPIAILCCNQPFFFNNGASDTSDLDSISYSWSPPLAGNNQQLSYSGTNYSYQHPFSAYYPGSLAPPYYNVNANPPIGIRLDPETGDIIFTPTRCDEVTVAVIKVTEWRKDSTGTYQNIGVTHRDLQFITKTCPNNNPPEVDGPYAYNVCEGSQLCFNVTTDDEQYIPPPPAQASAPDTVTNAWNRGIPGATYTIINPTARLQTGRFCWTPPLGSASDLPYTFTVTARDNACPLNAVTVRAFRVKVKPRANAERLVDTLDCGLYAFESDPEDGFKGTPSYQWTLLDSNRNIIFDRRIAKFTTSGTFISRKQKDSIQFRRGGTYIIQHDINNPPSNCPTTYFDTLVVPPLLEANLSLGPDTFVCAGTDLVFRPYLSNVTGSVEYQWSTMGVTDDGDFLNNVTANSTDDQDTFLLSVQNVVYDTAVAIWIKDGYGCTSEDTVQVLLKANPLAILPPDERICSYDSVKLIPNLDLAYWIDPIDGDTLIQGDTLEKEWFYNGEWIPFSIDDSVIVRQEGAYVIRVRDSLNCMDTDTFFLEVNDTVIANAGPDQAICFGNPYEVRALGLDTFGTGKSGNYRWFNITPSSTPTSMGFDSAYSRIANTDSLYRLELYINEGGITCFDDDTTFVAVKALPEIELIDLPGPLCCDEADYFLNFNIKTPTGIPSSGGWSCTEFPNLITNNAFKTDTACSYILDPARSRTFKALYTYLDPASLCIDSASIDIVVAQVPTVILVDKDYCQDRGAVKISRNSNVSDNILVSPANASFGMTWRCLDSNSTQNRFMQDMLENRGSQFSQDFWINIDESVYEIQNPDKDTIVLEFSYVNQFGCIATDTVDIRIWRVPTVEFSRNRDLCFDEGEIKLDSLTGINLSDGVWSCYDSTGFDNCSDFATLTGDTFNTTNSIDDDATHTWMMRYYHDATGCPAQNFIPVTINPLPVIDITALTPNDFCEDNASVPLVASPSGSGGVWTSEQDPASITGSSYNPQNATVFNQPVTLLYTYTSLSTGCVNSDSITAITGKRPAVFPIADTAFCREEGQMTKTLTFNIEGEFAKEYNWGSYTAGATVENIVVDANSPQQNANFVLQNQKADTFQFYVSAIAAFNKCPDNTTDFNVIVNPIPDASITNSNPADCDPVDTDFDVEIYNDVDPALALYKWNLGLGNEATTQTASGTYTTETTRDIDGLVNISVVVTSDKGCDTTLTSTVEVYPNPVASFIPDPNNYTTAALPRFTFNNTSEVDPIRGSAITENNWNFGDFQNPDIDTSTKEHPSYFYPTDTGSYYVTLNVVTNYGCEDEFTFPVVVGPDLIVYIPNAFTPDKAGPEINEGFSVVMSGQKTTELIIFDRWGEIVYQTDSVISDASGKTKTIPWDGTYKGLDAQQDVYAYKLVVTALNDEEYFYSGTITLIR